VKGKKIKVPFICQRPGTSSLLDSNIRLSTLISIQINDLKKYRLALFRNMWQIADSWQQTVKT
jgi:hypothetical protein